MTPGRRFRIYLLEARFQVVETLREPMFAIPTLTFPLIFYLFFGVIMGARGVSLAVPTYVLATYGVFGVLGPALFGFGAGLANERDTGVLLLKQTTPMPAGAYLFAKVMAALIFGAVVVAALFLMDAGQPVRMHLAVLAAETLVFLAVAALGFRRADSFSMRRSR